ncbi:MAG: transposase family protein [Gammaproteobacteria bacterium]|nr:transposase family protein [Gammaproteobacteria bacterium]
MNTIMNDSHIDTLDKVRKFLGGTDQLELAIYGKKNRYEFIKQTLMRFKYNTLSRQDKGAVLRYIARISGYSYVQVKRLAASYKKNGRISWQHTVTQGFARRYSNQDCELLAKTDELHDTLSGHATKKICERALLVFGQEEYANLACISVSHLYNLRKSRPYQKSRQHFEKTRSKPSTIGQRRKPQPNGEPGYIRVDTVHQGDLDKIKGVYHINAVDEVTQFEVICSTQKISEQFLIPILIQMLEEYPFVVRGFHADNGSEYINRTVAKMLNKMLIELTKSRARHSNDNALVECKNGAIVRKHLGFLHIPQKWAPLINQFTTKFLNPYLNFHRPCFFAEIKTNSKGKQIKTYPYRCMMTPYEKLKSLPDADQYLKANISFEKLDDIAHQMSDNEAAQQLNQEKNKLFKTIFGQK